MARNNSIEIEEKDELKTLAKVDGEIVE